MQKITRTKSLPKPNSSRPDAILLRHFASKLNETKVSRGWLGVGIDKEAAEKLAPKVAATLERYGVNRIISSDLPRAEQSAKLVAEYMDPKPEISSTRRLRTWNVGDMAGKKESETVPKRQLFIKYPDETPPDGEPFEEFLDRFRSELRSIEKPGVCFLAHGHHLLAAAAVFGNEEVDPKNLPSLDEVHPPGGVWGVWTDGEKVIIKRLDDEPSGDSERTPRSRLANAPSSSRDDGDPLSDDV